MDKTKDLFKKDIYRKIEEVIQVSNMKVANLGNQTSIKRDWASLRLE
jgi:hypothetical protein